MTTTQTITVRVNGDAVSLPAGATVATVIDQLDLPTQGIAVAVDGEMVPCGRWAQHAVGAGDQLEVVTAVQGG